MSAFSRRRVLQRLSSLVAAGALPAGFRVPSALASDLSVPVSLQSGGSFVFQPYYVLRQLRADDFSLTGVSHPIYGEVVVSGLGKATEVRYASRPGLAGAADEFTIFLLSNGALHTVRFLISIAPLLESGELPPPRAVIAVSDSQQLARVLNVAQAGDHIELADGEYPLAQEIIRPGLVIKAQNRGRAIITRPWKVNASGTILYSLRFAGVGVSSFTGEGSRMSRCTVSDLPYGKNAAMVFLEGCRNFTIEYSEFIRCAKWGIRVSAQPGKAAIGTRVSWCYFSAWIGKPSTNTHEALQFGLTSSHTETSLKALAEHNLFDKCNVDTECISIKSSDNTVRYNTLLDSKAHITNRHGERNVIEGNWVERSLGIRIHDRDVKVIGNRLIQTTNGLQVMAGNVAPTIWPRQGTHPAAYGALLAGNDADKTAIGAEFTGFQFAAMMTRIEGHSGPIQLLNQQNTQDYRQLPSSVPVPTAMRLTPADVGPAAARRPVVAS